MAGSSNFIEEATSKHPGAFRKQAENADMSTAEYATKVLKPDSKASTKTKRRANPAKTLSGLRAKRA